MPPLAPPPSPPPPRAFCQARMRSDDAVEIGCHLEVSPQCFSSRRQRPRDEIQTNQLETNEDARLSQKGIDERYGEGAGNEKGGGLGIACQEINLLGVWIFRPHGKNGIQKTQ